PCRKASLSPPCAACSTRRRRTAIAERTMSARYPTFAGDLLAFFAESGADLADIAILQPADPFLDTAGEDLRRRIYLTESETGETLCLRPEFTIPVCLDHIARRAATPHR